MHVLALVVAVAICGCNYMRHPTETTRWGQPAGTMVLGLEARGEVVNAFIENRGVTPQRIVAKGITLTITREGGSGGSGDVTKAMDAPVILLDRSENFETLGPKEHLATPINIGKLPSGTYSVTATYGDRIQKTGDWWSGSLTAGPIPLVVP